MPRLNILFFFIMYVLLTYMLHINVNPLSQAIYPEQEG